MGAGSLGLNDSYIVRGATFHSGLRHETANQIANDFNPFKTESSKEEFLIDEGNI